MTTPPPSIWKLRPNEDPRTPHHRAFSLLYEGESVKSGSSSECVAYLCEHGLPDELVETVEGCVTVAEWRASHEQAEKMRAAQREARAQVTAMLGRIPDRDLIARPTAEQVGRVFSGCGLRGEKVR